MRTSFCLKRLGDFLNYISNIMSASDLGYWGIKLVPRKKLWAGTVILPLTSSPGLKRLGDFLNYISNIMSASDLGYWGIKLVPRKKLWAGTVILPLTSSPVI